MKIQRDKEECTLCTPQRGYALGVVEKFGTGDCKQVYTPLRGKELAGIPSDTEPLDEGSTTNCEAIVGSLLYPAYVARFDIMYQTPAANPKHGQTYRRAPCGSQARSKCLKGNPELCITYKAKFLSFWPPITLTTQAQIQIMAYRAAAACSSKEKDHLALPLHPDDVCTVFGRERTVQFGRVRIGSVVNHRATRRGWTWTYLIRWSDSVLRQYSRAFLGSTGQLTQRTKQVAIRTALSSVPGRTER